MNSEKLPDQTLPIDDPNRLLTRKEAAEYLRLSPSTLAQWKSNGRYQIRTYKYANRIFYRVSDLRKFIDKHLQARSK